jgi:arylsulfate sulfotransferase
MTLIRKLIVAGCVIATGSVLSGAAMATPVLAVPTTSLPSPQPLGTSVTISYSATDTDPGVLAYRVQIGIVGSSTLSMMRDFNTQNSFLFTPELHAGNYQIVITAYNNATGNTASATIPSFKFSALASAGVPVLSPTPNALVALLSTPPCAARYKSVRASILRSGAAVPFATNWNNCVKGSENNILIAGMRASTQYTITPQYTNGTTITSGAPMSYTTGAAPVSLSSGTVVTPQTSADSQPERFYLMSLTTPQIPEAIDTSGTPVWYYLDPSGTTATLTRPIPGGDIMVYANGPNSLGNGVVNSTIVRQIDLAGNIVHETNASLLGNAVAAMAGLTQQCYFGGTECVGGSIDHEALQLPNGNYLVEMSEEQVFTNGAQGSSPSNPVDIIGDVIVELNPQLQVIWYWRAFDNLNVDRAAVLGETCANNQGGCPAVILASIANDWLHGNAIQYNVADGSFIFSLRHQDWIIKVNFDNGTGDGSTIWTMGLDGNFTINSSDPYPWFSHQHDPGFLNNGTTVLAVFDNGNTRVQPPPLGLGLPQGTLDGDSRGYVLDVDQVNMVVTPILLDDLGFYSEALGTSMQLTNGDYYFDAGFADAVPSYCQFIEVFPNATNTFTIQMGTNVKAYRSIRMDNLYTVPDKD